jgi:carotenoid cleavage dioxygenase-like enzyme
MPTCGGSRSRLAPCYVFHPLNAYADEHGTVVMDVVRYAELWRASWAGAAPASLHRWRIDGSAGPVSEQLLDDRAAEFPRFDERRTGVPYRSQLGGADDAQS